MARQPARLRPLAAAILLLSTVGVAGYLMREGHGLAKRSWEGPQRAGAKAMEPAVRWVQTHASADAVIAAENDPMLYLYSGRPSVPVLSWTAAELVEPQTAAVAETNLKKIQDQFSPGFVVLAGGGTPVASAVERMWREEGLLELVDTLTGGGAVFRPVHPR